MSDLLKRIEETLDKCTTLGGSLEIDCEELLRDCLDALQAKEESLDKANTQIERMREREKAPTDNGIPELDEICDRYNKKEICIVEMVCLVWNTALNITPPTDKGERL